MPQHRCTHSCLCSEERLLSGTQMAQDAQCSCYQQALRSVLLHHKEALKRELLYKQKLRSLKRASAQNAATTRPSVLHAARKTPDVNRWSCSETSLQYRQCLQWQIQYPHGISPSFMHGAADMKQLYANAFRHIHSSAYMLAGHLYL